VQLLKKKYIKYVNFLTSPTSIAALWFWKGIQKCKSFIQSGACLKVAVTYDFPIWTTSWVPTLPNYKPLPKFPNNQNMPIGFISDFILPGTARWNHQALDRCFDSISVQEIAKIHISSNTETTFFWTFSTSGRFTASSAYLALQNNYVSPMMPGTSANFWKSIWKLNLNDRLRLFIWKIAWNLFPTMEWLNAIFSSPDIDVVCPLCKDGEDSIQHLFFKCRFARVIWRNSFWPMDLLAFNFTNMLDWIKVIISHGATLKIPKEDHHRFQNFVAVACDFLWSSRNKAYHENLSFDALNVSRKINKVSLEHMVAWKNVSIPPEEKWMPPPPH
jgi:hypothetical protein